MKKIHMRLTMSILILIAALLTACGANTGPDVEPAAAPDEPLTALETAPDDAATPTPEAIAADDETEADEEGDSGQFELGEPIMPVEVDLSKITPEANDGTGENVVMPAPGQPGPPEALLESVIVDLERRLDATRDEAGILLTSSELLNWSDGSLGCPAPGMMYTMALVPGYQLIFTAGTKQYTYHTNLDGYFVLCVNGEPAR